MTPETLDWRAVAATVKGRLKYGQQKVLASRLNVEEGVLSNYLSGKREPPLEAVVAMADFFGVTLDELVGRTAGGPERAPTDDSGLRAAAEHLSAELSRFLSRPITSDLPAERGASSPANVVPFPDTPRGPDVDEPQDLHESEMEIVAYAAAGQDRHPEAVATGETVPVINHVYRRAQRGKWKVVKVVGDSMAPEYEPGDLVLVEPARDSTVRSGDVAYVMLNGECLLKVLAFRRDRDSGRFLELKLRSLNPRYPEIQVNDHDWFHVIGVEAYRIQRGRNFK